MAYNNGFPMTYQPYVPQYQVPQNQVQNNGLIWVQGEQAAKSYLTAPNTTVPLWDSESQRIYLKSTDASGMPSIKILEYSVVDPYKGQKDGLSGSVGKDIDYATKTDLKGIYERLAALEEKEHESDLPRNAGAKLNRTEVQPVQKKLHRRSEAGYSADA